MYANKYRRNVCKLNQIENVKKKKNRVIFRLDENTYARRLI